MKRQHLYEWIQLGANIATIAAVFFIWWQTNLNEIQIQGIREEKKFSRTLQLAELIDNSMLEMIKYEQLSTNEISYIDKIDTLQKIMNIAVQLGTCIKEDRINKSLIYPLITRHNLGNYKDYAAKIIDSKPINQRNQREANSAQSLQDYIKYNLIYLDELSKL